MTIKKIKNICIALSITLLMACVSAIPVYAAGLSVSVGQSRVSVGKEFTVTVRVSDDVIGWTYQITYSSNLTLVSGKTTPDGSDDEGSPHINTLIFRANSEGTGTITASCNNGLTDGNRDYSSSDSATIAIISATSDDGREPPYHGGGGNNTPSKSSNNALSSLTVSAGELTPAFDPAVTDYTLSLPLQSDKLTVTATPSDSKATVQGDGEVTLQGGENQVAVVVTAEDGSTKTYTIVVKVAQAPTLFLRYNDQRLGAVKDIEEVTPPTGFAPAEPMDFEGDSLPIWVNAAGDQALVYLVNEETAVAGFYLFSQATGVVLSPYIPLAEGTLPYVYTGIPDALADRHGLTHTTVEAFGATLDGWAYDDPAMKDFYVLYLMNADGIYGYYTYDSAKETLQRFSGAVYADSGDALRVPMLYVYIAGGAAAVLLILVIVLACVSGGRGKMLRQLRGDSADWRSKESPAAQPAEEPQEVLSTEQEELATLPEPEIEPESESEAEPQPSREEEPAPEGAAEDSTEEPVSEEPTEEPFPEQSEQSPAEEEAPPAKASLEDTLRNLPLDDLLRDIHDL